MSKEERPHITVTTPIGKVEVKIKEWLTGREREYVNAPLFESVKPEMGAIEDPTDMKLGQMNVGQFMKESAHREIATYVISVGEATEGVLDLVLDMHEDDMKFVRDEISKVAKKKGTQGTSSTSA